MKVNALMVRQSFGKILKMLAAGNEPLVIEKGRKPVAVLITLEMFQKRFVDFQEIDKKNAILAQFRDSAVKTNESSLSVLRDLRYG